MLRQLKASSNKIAQSRVHVIIIIYHLYRDP